MSNQIVPQSCPICGEDTVIWLPDNWQEQVNAGASIPIIGCGNPWHYANLDQQAVAAERARIRVAVEGLRTDRGGNYPDGWESAVHAVLAIIDREDSDATD